jgi:hypothetical protein
METIEIPRDLRDKIDAATFELDGKQYPLRFGFASVPPSSDDTNELGPVQVTAATDKDGSALRATVRIARFRLREDQELIVRALVNTMREIAAGRMKPGDIAQL